jgi:hypothetical protein
MVEEDIEKHTVTGNGISLKQEEVLSDFLNNKSARLKQIMK